MNAEQKWLRILPSDLQAIFQVVHFMLTLCRITVQHPIIGARVDDTCAGGFQNISQQQGDIEIYILFQYAIYAGRAAILPSVACVDDHQRRCLRFTVTDERNAGKVLRKLV